VEFANLKYRNIGRNLGDCIQSIAIAQHIGRPAKYFFRDELHQVCEPEVYHLVLNGNFHQGGGTFPPSSSIKPIFFGFRVAGELYERMDEAGEHLDYLRAHAPIGCRDRATMDMLRARGIDAYLSLCLTLTFPKRRDSPANGGRIFLVDLSEKGVSLPQAVRQAATALSHDVDPDNLDRLNGLFAEVGLPEVDDGLPDAEREMRFARTLLRLYRRHASLVITTKLHACLPSVAMGIPVIYFQRGDDFWIEGRLALLDEIGITRHRYQTPPYKIDWNPAPLDIDKLKRTIRRDIRAAIMRATREGAENGNAAKQSSAAFHSAPGAARGGRPPR